ncbi:MAG: hypothetical protein EZS28_047433, partial [Streblomastix strix]
LFIGIRDEFEVKVDEFEVKVDEFEVKVDDIQDLESIDLNAPLFEFNYWKLLNEPKYQS